MKRDFRTHYANLQVAENASIEVIRGAYKYLSQKWHPDKHPDDKERAARVMRMINVAYAVLSDPERRRQHDDWIAAKRKQAKGESSGSGNAGEEPANEQEEQAEPEKTTEDTVEEKNESSPDESKKFFGGIYHPWPRWFARSIDVSVIGSIVSFIFFIILENVSPQSAEELYRASENRLIAILILFALWMPVEAVFLSTLSTTPAKWFLGITITKHDGSRLSFSEALSRSFLVWVQGMGFGIPLIALFTMYFASKRLAKTGTTLWDKSVGSVVQHKKLSPQRTAVAIIFIFISAYLMLVVIPQIERVEYVHESAGPSNKEVSFYIENQCNHPLSIILQYRDVEGVWRMEEGTINGGVAGYLTDKEGNEFKTNNAVWYYYAQTTDGSDWEWAGDELSSYAGVDLPMIRAEDHEGDNDIILSCE